MRKLILSGVAKWMIIPVLSLFLFSACSKDDDSTPAFQGRSKTYKLYNYSTGSTVEAGTVMFSELQNGGASSTINLSSGYRVPGVKFKSTITVTDASGVELVYSDLGDVDGTSGVGEKKPIMSSGTNATISYDEIVAKMGYTVKVMNGSNVQARGVIQ